MPLPDRIPGTAGDVSKVGTPIDNEIGVWTGNGTLEGDTNFQWNGSAFKFLGTQFIKEQAAAAADITAYGQIWIKTATPNELWFTDDAGTDVQLGTGSANAVASAAVIVDHTLVRGDGGARGVQDSGITINDTDDISGVHGLTATGNLDIGAHDFRARNLTADALTAARLVYAGASGLLTTNAALAWDGSVFTIDGSIQYKDVIGGSGGPRTLIPSGAQATTANATIYVDSGAADDTGTGASGDPLKTIQKAIDILPAAIAHDVVIAVMGDHTLTAPLDLSGITVLGTLTIKAMDTSDVELYDNGTADAGAGNSELDDTAKAWSVDMWNGGFVWIYKGTGMGQIRAITDTTATKLTLGAAWTVNPDATSLYVIVLVQINVNAQTYGLQNLPDNLGIYGFQFSGAGAYAIYLTNARGQSYYFNCFDTFGVAGLLLNNFAGVIARYNYFAIPGAGDYGTYVREKSSLSERYNMYIAQTANAGTGLYADNHCFVALRVTSECYYDDLDKGIVAVNGSVVKSGSLMTFNSCTTNLTPAAASDPAYIS